MNQSDLFEEEPRLFENLCSTLYLSVGFEQVKKNKGKPGIDGVSIMDFEASLDEELSMISIFDGLIFTLYDAYNQKKFKLPFTRYLTE